MVSCDLTVSDLPGGTFGVGDIEVTTGTVSHPGPTVAVRVEADDAVMVYVPDHEPGIEHVEGHDDDATRALCSGADLLVHDAMYLDRDYARSTGFGHCSVSLFAEFIESLDGLGVVVPFHQDPSYTDDVRDQLMADAVDRLSGHRLVAPLEGSVHQV